MKKFSEFIVEAHLAAPNLFSHKDRLDNFEEKMRTREEFQMEDGTKLVFPLNQHNASEIERLRNYKKGDKFKFQDENGAFHLLSKFTKTSDLGGGGKTLNSEGKKLADAGERATLLYLVKDIETPEDTGEQLFIDNPKAFERWKQTFVLTKEALELIVSNLKKYDIIHDSTDKGNFVNIINSFCLKIKKNKDSWNPADTWLIKKSARSEVEKTLYTILHSFEGNNLINRFNTAIYNFYTSKKLIPVSLKQITNSNYTIEYNNVPGTKIPFYDYEIDKFICNMKMDSVEIGIFSFTNKNTKKKLKMQTKGYPFSTDSTQTEITSDGTKTGGRLGKVPASIVKKVYEEYNFFKIVPSKYFAKDLSKTPKKQIKEWVKWYKKVQSEDSLVEASMTVEELEEYLPKLLRNISAEDSKKLKHKVQGLAMQYFFITHKKDISTILTKFILGAKKINPDNGFFVKIY